MRREDNINVFVRMRPYNDKQPNTSFVTKMTEAGLSVKEKQRDNELQFGFDHVFGMSAGQEMVYEKVGRPVVESAFQGFNGTIFAYGQTSSGKTHTCIGPNFQDEMKRGILPRLVSNIFQKITQVPPFVQFRIKVSMVEIYMQKIRDLLDSSKTDLKIRENKAKGVYMQDVTEEYVASPAETFNILQRGINNRTIGSTNMNQVSSRSHMAFIMAIHQNNLKDLSAKSSKIILIDLAGSEKVGKTQAEGRLLQEAKQINKSLSALGNVINALTEAKVAHVPYRDSKLTRLLQQSLGGNSRTNLIINISPSTYNAVQSISSLRFGLRAKQIKNKPKVNKEYTVQELLLLLEKAERRIAELEQNIKEITNANLKRFSKKNQDKKFVENLLDSQNPLQESEVDEDGNRRGRRDVRSNTTKEPFMNAAKMSDITLKFDSDVNSDDEDNSHILRNQTISAINVNQIANEKNVIDNYQIINRYACEQKDLLLQELRELNGEKTELKRQLDIMTERNQYLLKEMRQNGHKLASQVKENETLLQKFIQESIVAQEKQHQLESVKEKLADYEDNIRELDALLKGQLKEGKSHGNDKEVMQQVHKLVSLVRSWTNETEVQRETMAQQATKGKSKGDMQLRIKELQQQLQLLQNLQGYKESLTSEKLQFTKQREQIYRDLQNRIDKVLWLEEKLDEEKENTKYLTQVLEMDQKDKSRKIVSLQRDLDTLSQKYYAIKGRETALTVHYNRVEAKLQEKILTVSRLQRQAMDLKMLVQTLTLKCEQLEAEGDQVIPSILESPFAPQKQYNEQPEWHQPKIVKIVRSSYMPS